MPGHTLILDVSDPSNFNYTPAFSTTPDGTHNGGTEYNVGVTRVGTPGTSGAQISLTYTQTTPKQIYIYAQETPKVGVRGSEFIAPTVHFRATMFCKWYLARISQQTNGLDYGLYSYTEDGDGVDLYVIDAGVRGASRPVNATGANLHPELYHPDHIADLNGATEQANYRVYEVPGFNSGYTVNGEADSNEDDNGHGTNCAICATGLQHGVSRKTRIYALKTQGSNGSGLLSSYVNAILAIINHNDPNHPNWKGNNRPAVINASVGVNIPSENYQFVPQNEPGFDSGAYEADTAMDDYEKSANDAGIVFVRSAGNGFGYNVQYGGYQAKFNPGPRTAGPQDYQYNMEGICDKISVGATTMIDTFTTFSNYGTGVTTSAPGESIYVPLYYWNSNSAYNTVTSSYYGCIQGTSFSGPLTAGVICQYLGVKNIRTEQPMKANLCLQWQKNGCAETLIGTTREHIVDLPLLLWVKNLVVVLSVSILTMISMRSHWMVSTLSLVLVLHLTLLVSHWVVNTLALILLWVTKFSSVFRVLLHQKTSLLMCG